MSYIKVPSWIEVIKLGCLLGRLGLSKTDKSLHEQSFWKEQALRFGFDIREALGLQSPDSRWKSFFYEKFFQYTLKRVDNNLQNLKQSEKNFWKRNGRFIEKLKLTSMNKHDLELMLSWFPNLRHLTLKQCNTLLQGSSSILTGIKKLHTLEIHNTHILTEKAFLNIPATIQKLIIKSAKSITNEFFNELHNVKQLYSLALQNCHSLQLHQLLKLPDQLKELDLSGSGKNIIPDVCFHLPRALLVLKMNGWDHFTDNELALLPQGLKKLEIEGWQLAANGTKALKVLPLNTLNLSRVTCDNFHQSLQNLPHTIRRLSLSQNALSAKDLQCLANFTSLVELDLSYALGFNGVLDDAPIVFPKTLKSLNLSCCGNLHKKSIRSLKNLINLKKLNASGCAFENSDLEWLPEGLEHVDLCLSINITDEGLIPLGALSQLRSLYLDGCEQIRGFGLLHLSASVQRLSLAGCHRLSGKSLIELPQNIEELSLDSCELVMVEDIQSLPATMQVLNLARCINIGNEAVDYLSSLPLLNTISLQGCPKITEIAIAKLVRRKFEGTIIIKSDLLKQGVHAIEDGDIELHPPAAILRKLTNFKARLVHKLKTQALR